MRTARQENAAQPRQKASQASAGVITSPKAGNGYVPVAHAGFSETAVPSVNTDVGACPSMRWLVGASRSFAVRDNRWRE